MPCPQIQQNTSLYCASLPDFIQGGAQTNFVSLIALLYQYALNLYNPVKMVLSFIFHSVLFTVTYLIMFNECFDSLKRSYTIVIFKKNFLYCYFYCCSSYRVHFVPSASCTHAAHDLFFFHSHYLRPSYERANLHIWSFLFFLTSNLFNGFAFMNIFFFRIL